MPLTSFVVMVLENGNPDGKMPCVLVAVKLHVGTHVITAKLGNPSPTSEILLLTTAEMMKLLHNVGVMPLGRFLSLVVPRRTRLPAKRTPLILPVTMMFVTSVDESSFSLRVNGTLDAIPTRRGLSLGPAPSVAVMTTPCLLSGTVHFTPRLIPYPGVPLQMAIARHDEIVTLSELKFGLRPVSAVGISTPSATNNSCHPLARIPQVVSMETLLSLPSPLITRPSRDLDTLRAITEMCVK